MDLLGNEPEGRHFQELRKMDIKHEYEKGDEAVRIENEKQSCLRCKLNVLVTCRHHGRDEAIQELSAVNVTSEIPITKKKESHE